VAKVYGSSFPAKTAKRRTALPFIVTYWKGRAYARTKPSQKPRPATPAQRRWIENFKCDQRAVKWASPQERERAEELAPESGFYPRDVIVFAWNGHGIRWDGEAKILTPTVQAYGANETLTGSGVAKYLTVTGVNWDNNAFWNPTLNPDRLTVQSAGLYYCYARVWFKPATASVASAGLYGSSGREAGRVVQNVSGSSDGVFNLAGLEYFNAGEYLRCQVYRFIASSSVQLLGMGMVAITPEAIIP